MRVKQHDRGTLYIGFEYAPKLSWLVGGEGRSSKAHLAALHPTVISEVNNILEHEAQTAFQALVVGQLCNALEVYVHVLFCLFVVDLGSDGAHQLAEALHVLRVGGFDIPQQLLYAFVHDPLSEHLLFVEVTNKLDVSKHPFSSLEQNITQKHEMKTSRNGEINTDARGKFSPGAQGRQESRKITKGNKAIPTS